MKKIGVLIVLGLLLVGCAGTEFYRTPEETLLLKEALSYNEEE